MASGGRRSSDLLLIERVLYGLWAPADADPQAPVAQTDEDDPVTNNDVIRARRAFTRLSEEATRG